MIDHLLGTGRSERPSADPIPVHPTRLWLLEANRLRASGNGLRQVHCGTTWTDRREFHHARFKMHMVASLSCCLRGRPS